MKILQIALRLLGLIICIPIICILVLTLHIKAADTIIDFWGIG